MIILVQLELLVQLGLLVQLELLVQLGLLMVLSPAFLEESTLLFLEQVGI